jgi:hypothetical protein
MNQHEEAEAETAAIMLILSCGLFICVMAVKYVMGML